MGNCCICASSVVWAGDDWGSVEQGKNSDDHHSVIEKQRLLGEETMGGFSSSSSSSTREIKIKITKRELDELMARVDMQGLSMEQVLARFINSSPSSLADYTNLEMDYHHHHRSWKPALQSIPEVN